MDTKLNFTLTPVSGTLKKGGGYRAKFGKRNSRVLGLDTIIREAKEDGAFFGVSSELMKLYVRGILQSMIDRTAADGITRRIDDYLSVSLKIHGKFDSEDEDFDSDKHELALSLRPLAAFRPKFKLRPVNVNRKRQFRIYSITVADGSRKVGQVVWQKDFRIKGDDLIPDSGEVCVMAQMKGPDGVLYNVDPEIVSATEKEIVCHWPKEFGAGYEHGRLLVAVDKPIDESDWNKGTSERCKYAVVYPD